MRVANSSKPVLCRILHVDDDASIRGVVKLTLERLGGYEVLSLACGEEALRRVRDFAPQLILLDVMMPVMDGPAILMALRDLIDLHEVPVLFMTAKVQASEQQRMLALGALGVIIKPFDPMTLSSQVSDWWGRYHGE